MVLPAPRYVQLYPTVGCNQHCFFCFNGFRCSSSGLFSHGGSALRDLSLPESLRLLRILGVQGIEEIDVMGGEPLLLPWMPEFAKTASERGIKINISTNGSCPKAIAQFKDYNRDKITIGVSLEGSCEERHNTITGASHFSLAMDTIETLLSLNFDVVVKTVVSRTTVPDISKIIDLLRRMGIKRYYLIHMDVLTKDVALIREALSFPEFRIFCSHVRETNPDMEISMVSASCFTKELIGRRARCSGGVNKLSILPDGSVFPCNLFHPFPELRLGNILKEDFASIWNNSRLETFREPAGSCFDNLCANRSYCTGGCPAHSYYHYGSLDARRDVRCEPTGNCR